MEVYINDVRIPFLEGHGMSKSVERTPVYAFGENAPIGFGDERSAYMLHFKRIFPKGFSMVEEDLGKLVDFKVKWVEGGKETTYLACNWQKQRQQGDEWVQNEELAAKSYERILADG